VYVGYNVLQATVRHIRADEMMDEYAQITTFKTHEWSVAQTTADCTRRSWGD